MAELERFTIKYVRDYIKKDYKVRDFCYICNSTEHLELHHLYGVSELFNNWLDKNKIKLNDTVEQIKELRILFAKDCAEALSNSNLYTLCKNHHLRLHNIYSQRYANSMAPKVKNWIEIQKAKYGN